MVLNIGYMENSFDNGDVRIRVYYDANVLPAGDSQPLINGPRGYCLDITNVSGRKATAVITKPDSTQQRINIPKGDPVVSRSMTAAQLAAIGLTTRGQVRNFTITTDDA